MLRQENDHCHRESGARPVRIDYVYQLLLALFALTVGHVASAEESFKYPEPSWPTESSEINEVIIENVYYFRTRRYSRPVVLWPTTALSEPDLTSPEKALQTFVQAMGKGDHQRWLNSWTPEDRRQLRATDEEKGRDAQFWSDAWSRVFKVFPKMELTRRDETLGRVILTYVKRGTPGSDREEFASSVVFVQGEAGQWQVTNSFQADPVFLYSGAPETSVRRVSRKVDLE